MRFVADESVDDQIVERLRQAGYHVDAITESSPSISDDEVLDRANQTNAMLLTADKDFGELVFRLGRVSRGVVLIRLSGLAAETKADIVVGAIEEHFSQLPEAFTVIAPGVIRIRKADQL